MTTTLRLLLGLWVLFGISCTETEQSQSSPSSPPNILFLIADDWSYPHASAYGDPVVRTPTFDRLADEGILFHNAYCTVPSCTPSRGAILTGQYPHRLEDGGNLWSTLKTKFPNYVSLLKEAGYEVGMSRKGWAPGDFEAGGYTDNPAGPRFKDFQAFHRQCSTDKPFCYWFGSSDPHRIYRTNSGYEAGMDREAVVVPGFLPDTTPVRHDILDYFFEVERFDRDCGEIIRYLEEKGELENTLIVMTSDNGMPFPRAKANLYDYGTRMPMVIRWGNTVKSGQVSNTFVNSIDYAPTFLEAAGLPIPAEMSGKSLLPMLQGQSNNHKEKVYLERERHAQVRAGNLSYPSRAIRTDSFLYIVNLEADRWPAGDPEVHQSVGQFGDIDNSICKFLIIDRGDRPGETAYYSLALGKRPKEELYLVQQDPYQLENLADDPVYASVLADFQQDLASWMEETADLRAKGKTNYWDQVHYVSQDGTPAFDLQARIKAYSEKMTP